MCALDESYGQQVMRASRGSAFWKETIYLPQVESTNDVAKDLGSQGAPAGTVIVADEQTAGRGRRDRRWVAPPGTCLLCSMLFRPNLPPAQGQRLTMLCSMAAADAIETAAGLPVALKWPNDLVLRSRLPGHPTWRKLAGLLTEMELQGDDLDYLVVGIGINVNVPRHRLVDLAPNATSMLTEIGSEIDRSTLLMALLDATETRYRRFEDGENPRQEWAARLVTLGRLVRVATDQGVLEGVAEGVDQNGALLLRTGDGTLRTLLAGDVTLSRV